MSWIALYLVAGIRYPGNESSAGKDVDPIQVEVGR